MGVYSEKKDFEKLQHKGEEYAHQKKGMNYKVPLCLYLRFYIHFIGFIEVERAHLAKEEKVADEAQKKDEVANKRKELERE